MQTKNVMGLGLSLAVLASGCVGDAADAASLAGTESVDCTVTATGTLPAGDVFSGNAVGFFDGTASGTWEHRTPERTVTVCECAPGPHRGWCRGVGHEEDGEGLGLGHDQHDHDEGDCTTITERDTLVGSVVTMSCFIDGSSLAVLSGTGTWNGVAGYTFDLAVTDDAPDEYEIIIRDPSMSIVYATPTSAPANVPDSGDIVVVGL